MPTGFWKTGGKLYMAGIVAYFAAAGVQALLLPSFPDWLSFMSRNARDAFAWPVVAPIEINSWRRPSSPATVVAANVDYDAGQSACRECQAHRLVQLRSSRRAERRHLGRAAWRRYAGY